MTCGCDDYNPADFTLRQNTVFGPTEDNLTPSIVFKELLDGVEIPLTGYTAKMSMKPVSGGAITLTLLSTGVDPNSRLIIDEADGSISPYFKASDVTMAPGKYRYDILMENDEDAPIYVVGGIITVESTVTTL